MFIKVPDETEVNRSGREVVPFGRMPRDAERSNRFLREGRS